MERWRVGGTLIQKAVGNFDKCMCGSSMHVCALMSKIKFQGNVHFVWKAHHKSQTEYTFLSSPSPPSDRLFGNIHVQSCNNNTWGVITSVEVSHLQSTPSH